MLNYMKPTLMLMIVNVFWKKNQTHVLTAGKNLKQICESELTTAELKKALFSMKKGEASGIDGLSIEF